MRHTLFTLCGIALACAMPIVAFADTTSYSTAYAACTAAGGTNCGSGAVAQPYSNVDYANCISQANGDQTKYKGCFDTYMQAPATALSNPGSDPAQNFIACTSLNTHSVAGLQACAQQYLPQVSAQMNSDSVINCIQAARNAGSTNLNTIVPQCERQSGTSAPSTNSSVSTTGSMAPIVSNTTTTSDRGAYMLPTTSNSAGNSLASGALASGTALSSCLQSALSASDKISSVAICLGIATSTDSSTGEATQTSASSDAAQQSQINALISQLSQLQQQLSQPITSATANVSANASSPSQGSTSTSCAALQRTLSRGMSGSDVQKLQNLLIAQGFLAAGNNTGYFGNLTQAAVQAFQAAHNIVSSGTPATTGYGSVGPRTHAALGLCGS